MTAEELPMCPRLRDHLALCVLDGGRTQEFRISAAAASLSTGVPANATAMLRGLGSTSHTEIRA